MKSGITILLVWLTAICIGQNIPPRTWRDHTNINTANSVCRFNNKVYVSNSNGIVIIDGDYEALTINQSKAKFSQLNKANGLNDVGVKLLRVNPNNNKLLVIYQNSAIDIINSSDEVRYFADIKNKIINGKKLINEVFFRGSMAYLACGFGIVVFDTDKFEVKDTYVLGLNGTNTEVYQVAMDDSLIFAATERGLLRCNYKLKNLNNFNNWVKIIFPNNPLSAPVGGVIKTGNKFLATYNPAKVNTSLPQIDTLYESIDNANWAKSNAVSYPSKLFKFSHHTNEFFTIFDQFGLLVRNTANYGLRDYITSFNGKQINLSDSYFIINESSGQKEYWITDLINGFFYTTGQFPFFRQYKTTNNGLASSLSSQVDIFDGIIASAPSHPDKGGGSIYTRANISYYENDKWVDLPNRNLDSGEIIDLNAVYIDRKDKSRIFGSSFSSGIYEYKNNVLVAVYNQSNTAMQSSRIMGMTMDKDGNLWTLNSGQQYYLNVLKKSGGYQTFQFNGPKFTRRLLIDKNNFIWMVHEDEGGITVYNPGSNFNPPQLNVNLKYLNQNAGTGNLGTEGIHCIAEDKDGKLWIGTSAGIRVVYNSSSVFSSSKFDAEPIKIVQDGNVELLLEKDIVTAITIDGANNKWVGTADGGLYCFNPDGQKQLFHFTKDNSPLYSNNILDVNYDEKTGDVYIATENGLQSYRSTVLEGEEVLTNVIAYPNPVRPNYQGTVLVKGLIDNAIVKITDQSGNIVWETKSKGGQIEWNLTTFANARVKTGVYIIYSTSTDGQQRIATKLLVIN